MDDRSPDRTVPMPSRRRFVVALVGAVGAGLLAACQQGASPSPAAPKAETKATEAPKPAAPAQQAPAAAAQGLKGRSMTSSAFGGDTQAVQKRVVFDAFEQATGAATTLVTLLSADALARARAEKGNPQLDLVQFSGGQEKVAAQEGISQPIAAAQIPNLSGVAETFRDPQNRWATTAAIAEGILYRTDKVNPAPTSWKDFWRQDVQGHVAFPDISNGYGMNFLVMAARINGGGEQNIDPGFTALKEIAPRATIFKAAAEVAQLFSQGDIWIMPYDSSHAFRVRGQGMPVQFAAPTEGTPAIFITASVLAGSNNADVANAAINFMLDPKIQAEISKELRWAPAVTSAPLEPDVAADVPNSPEEIQGLLALDSDAINAGRPQWTERWNREIARA
jgi:putative spermidine/putrescine transport system substrate-binding protein